MAFNDGYGHFSSLHFLTTGLIEKKRKIAITANHHLPGVGEEAILKFRSGIVDVKDTPTCVVVQVFCQPTDFNSRKAIGESVTLPAVRAQGQWARIRLADRFRGAFPEIFNGYLELWGCGCDMASSGEMALFPMHAVARAGAPYDLVIFDMPMPEMDGLEATRRIRDGRAAAGNPALPIIAMTAHAMKGDREKCLEAGMTGYISIPIQPDRLLKTIEKHLPGDDFG